MSDDDDPGGAKWAAEQMRDLDPDLRDRLIARGMVEGKVIDLRAILRGVRYGRDEAEADGA